ncbi:CU044_2847 family protein [Streptomyces avermitilis]|uniref:CU044_2847 family protein n=1 Tax=Streptomyces avermitilis TaxID=33903 RepID=UPI0033ACB99E
MSDLVRFETEDGSAMVVEVEDTAPGLENVSRDDNGVLEASRRLDQILSGARPTIEALLGLLRQLAPDEYEVEFGIKLNAEAGVVVAKTASEGHFNVRLAWQRPAPGTADDALQE